MSDGLIGRGEDGVCEYRVMYDLKFFGMVSGLTNQNTEFRVLGLDFHYSVHSTLRPTETRCWLR